MNEIDWSKPLEAVHEDGRVVAVEHLEPGSVRTEWSIRPKLDTWYHVFMPDGRSVSPVSGWRIRNVQPSTPSPDPQLYQEMVELIERVARADNGGFAMSGCIGDARSLAKRLKPEDPVTSLVHRLEEAAGKQPMLLSEPPQETVLAKLLREAASTLASQERQA